MQSLNIIVQKLKHVVIVYHVWSV